MATLSPLDTRFGLDYVPSSVRMRLGKREIFISRSIRKRYSPINAVLDCSTGNEPGYIELVLLRRWLIVLSRVR